MELIGFSGWLNVEGEENGENKDDSWDSILHNKMEDGVIHWDKKH